MKREKQTKRRTTTITMDMGVPVQINSFSVTADGQFRFFDQDGNLLHPARAMVDRGYERIKGQKILSRFPVSAAPLISSDPNIALLRYDTIFALDTNTRIVDGQKISVAAIILAKWMERTPGPRLGYATTHALEFRDVDCHPDLLALMHHILQMENDPNRAAAGEVAFIIDSHLGNLAKISSRDLPVLDNCYLPEWASLVYASDSTSDSLVNVLLRTADKAATSLLRHIEGGAGYKDSQVPAPRHSSYFRVWHFKGAC